MTEGLSSAGVGLETISAGQLVRLPGQADEWHTVDLVQPGPDGGATIYALSDAGELRKFVLAGEDLQRLEVLSADGCAPSARVLAGMWTKWMRAATTNAASTLLASSPLRPYAHQFNAVYGAMLPQPFLRFLLADEPGTGKTIMAALYIREMQRLGLIKRSLIVVPAARSRGASSRGHRYVPRLRSAGRAAGDRTLGHDGSDAGVDGPQPAGAPARGEGSGASARAETQHLLVPDRSIRSLEGSIPCGASTVRQGEGA